MNKKERTIVGQIYDIAKDKRKRVLKDDHIKWLETKLREIKRLTKLLSKEDTKGKKIY